jgi:hypothetical protein
MSRKHFIAVAAAIRSQLPTVNTMSSKPEYRQAYTDGVKDVARTLCEVFAAGNPRFDRARFLSACGIE